MNSGVAEHCAKGAINMKLGIDVGRVLISPGDDSAPDTSFIGGTLEDALRTPPYEGVFAVVPRLVEKFEGRVWIISKCGPRIQDRTRQWLKHHRFFERTGIPEGHLRFCLRRPQKALHCADLGITHFIDDRFDVLDAMRGVVPNRYLFGPQREDTQRNSPVTEVLTWADVARLLL
jgi:hypothetical protein